MKDFVKVTVSDLETSAKDDINHVYYFGSIEVFWTGIVFKYSNRGKPLSREMVEKYLDR